MIVGGSGSGKSSLLRAGVLPWLIAGRVLKRDRVGSGGIRFFDRVIFPVCRRLEDIFPPSYGLNLAAIGVK